jgi:hypothetical protein
MNVDYKALVANPEIRANIERADQANFDLLGKNDWKKLPAKVLLAILRKLGHPAPDNLTRD